MSQHVSPFIPPMSTPRMSPHTSPAVPVIPDPPPGAPPSWATGPQHAGSYPGYPASPYTSGGFIPTLQPHTPAGAPGAYLPPQAPMGYYTPAGPPHAPPPLAHSFSANHTGYPSLVPQSAPPIMHHNTPYGPPAGALPPQGGGGAWPGTSRPPYQQYGPSLQSAGPYPPFPSAYQHHGPPPGHHGPPPGHPWGHQTPSYSMLNFDGWPPQTPTGPPSGWPAQMGMAPPPPHQRGPSQSHVPDYLHGRADVRVGDRMGEFVAGNNYGPVLEPLLIHIVGASLQLNPLLEPLSETGADRIHLKWNMLFESNDCQRSTDPNHISWSIGRDEPATYPRITSLKLVSETFPWTIEVRAKDPNVGVTCGEVIDTLSDDFQKLASKADYDTLSSQKKVLVTEAYRFNRSRAPGVPGGRLKDGMRRLDYFGKDTVFGGICKDDRIVKKIMGASFPCTFVLKCVRRYALTAEEIRDHEARQRAREANRRRIDSDSDDDGARPTSRSSHGHARRRSATVSTVTSTSDDD